METVKTRFLTIYYVVYLFDALNHVPIHFVASSPCTCFNTSTPTVYETNQHYYCLAIPPFRLSHKPPTCRAQSEVRFLQLTRTRTRTKSQSHPTPSQPMSQSQAPFANHHSLPHVRAGVLIECDPSIKSIIVNIDSHNHDYIIEDLDDERVVVKENMVPLLKSKLEEVRFHASTFTAQLHSLFCLIAHAFLAFDCVASERESSARRRVRL